MRYFYARVSSKEQNLDRQLAVAEGYDKPIDRIFTDKQSGKNMERAGYREMKSLLREGDEVIIKELDRLGRNKELVKDEIRWYKDNRVTLRILNVPSTMIEFGDQEWIGDMVTNILIEVLAAVAENERVKIHQRQAEGIAAMDIVDGKHISKKTGRAFGPEVEDVPEFRERYRMVQSGLMTPREGWESLGICKSRWYRMAKRCG